MTQPGRKTEGIRLISSLRLTLFAGAAIALATAFGLSVEEYLALVMPDHPLGRATIIVLCAFLVGLVFAYWQHDNLERLVQADAQELESDELVARAFLITGFSPLNPPQLADVGLRFPPIDKDDPAAGAAGAHRALHDVAAICADETERQRLGSWQQSLRLIHFLIGLPAGDGESGLKAVYVIDNGRGQEDAFRAMLGACFPGLPVTVLPEDKDDGQRRLKAGSKRQLRPDYEHFEFVSVAFDRAFAAIMRDHRMPREAAEAATYIDVTPGFKVFSIAAAIQTLNRRAMFLYVSSATDPERVGKRPGGYTILGYDVHARFSLGRR